MVHDVNNINIQAKSTKLELDNVGGIFILLAVGLIIGLLCLICESGVKYFKMWTFVLPQRETGTLGTVLKCWPTCRAWGDSSMTWAASLRAEDALCSPSAAITCSGQCAIILPSWRSSKTSEHRNFREKDINCVLSFPIGTFLKGINADFQLSIRGKSMNYLWWL